MPLNEAESLSEFELSCCSSRFSASVLSGAPGGAVAADVVLNSGDAETALVLLDCGGGAGTSFVQVSLVTGGVQREPTMLQQQHIDDIYYGAHRAWVAY